MAAAGRVVLLALLACAGNADAASPVQKVIELLEDNKAKVVKDLAAEEASMEKYMDFCDTETSEKQYAITTATRKIASLSAEIQDGEAQIAEYDDEVAALGTSLAEKEKQLDQASAVRAAENAAFLKNEAELVESIDELERALMEIKRSSGAGLVQIRGGARAKVHRHIDLKSALVALGRIVDASWVNAAARHQIQGLLQTTETASSEEADGDDLRMPASGAPEVQAFESSAGGILQTLEDMQSKAEQALTDARTSETREKHSHEMMAQSLTNAIETAKEKIADAKSAINTQGEQNGESRNELTETTKNKASDEKYLSSLTADCSNAREGWATRQQEGKDEIGALMKAKEILAQNVKVTFLVQTKGIADDDSDAEAPAEAKTRQAVLAKLKSLSKQFNSYALMEMVSAVVSDPFAKIRGLIENMIAKLVDEANREATQKQFCDEEEKKSKASQAEKSMDLEKLTSRIDTAASKKADLINTVKELEGELAALDKATSEATALRSKEKADNEQAMKDYKQAAEAVESAMQVLKEYYEGASLAQTSSVARSARQPTFGGAKSDAASSILSILEMCGEDFTKMYLETQQEEATAVAAYKKLSAESAVSKAAKQAEVKGSNSEIKSLDVALKNHQEDASMTSSELDAVVQYLLKLKPQCESKAMSYGEKKARCDAELAGLKEALALLSGS